jgi:SAM-dependent methyltransferase
VDHLLRATARAEARHFWFRGFRYFVEPLVRHATTGLSGAAILDCGCGTGSNVEWLSGFGTAWGFDLAATGLRIGRELGRTHLARGSVAAAPFPGNRFDLVTSFDVLYSLEKPVEGAAVAEMFRLTRPGGFIIVNVAAMAALRGDHSVLSRELRRYTRDELRLLLTSAGFEMVRITYTNAMLFAPMAAARAWQRWRGLSGEAEGGREISVPPAPVNLALASLLKIESLWLPYVSSPFGSSLLALARKPGGRSV